MALILDESIAGGRPTRPVRPVRVRAHVTAATSTAVEGLARALRSVRVRLLHGARA
ncbi:hypothetical protein [Euzebya sp.]|uniref:hypothetical protein n=1 Tax=Euzebya sp. TaxID=1971409 RepID=UPI003510DB84